jgi:hypothetical protein
VEHGGKRRPVYVTFVTDLEGIAMSEIKTPAHSALLNCPRLICLGFWQLSRQWRDFFSSLVRVLFYTGGVGISIDGQGQRSVRQLATPAAFR